MISKKSPLILILCVLSFLFLSVVFISALSIMGRKSEKVVGASNQTIFKKAVRLGVLEITGVIMESKKVIERIDKLAEDKSIKGVIVRINSPGGAVAPSQEILNSLKKLRAVKPVYASFSTVAASGGYYIAMGASKIFADPGSLTGSIGVIMQFADLSKLYEWAKVSPYNIKTGKFKDIGSPNRQMSVDERALMQGLVDNVLNQFRLAVVEGRKLPMEKVVEVSDGRIFSGEQAKELKLIDELGGIEETAAAMVAELKGTGKPALVYPHEKHRFLLEKLLDDEDPEESSKFSGVLTSVLSKLLFGHAAEQLPQSVFQPGLMFLMPMGH